MFFRNLILFRFPATFGDLIDSPVADALSGFEKYLDECRLKPVGPLEISSRGFVSPFGRDSDVLAHTIGNTTWVTVGGEDKILPGSVVNELLARKLDEIEEKEGRKPGGRTRKRLKEDLIHELLPRAFVSPVRLDAYFDFDNHFIAVDTSSRRTSECVVSEIRAAVGTFPALPLNAEVSPRSILTGWLAGEPMPEGLTLGEECELKDAMDGGAIVKCQSQDLLTEEITKHLEAGKQVTRLALILEDRLSFVIGEDLVIRKLRFLDGAVDELEGMEREDLRAELDARFALMAGELARLFTLLESTFRISAADGNAQAPPVHKREPKVFESSVDPLQQKLIQNGTDPLMADAIAFVRESQKASVSVLQSHLKVGYNRAARLIEALEVAGVISAPDSVTGSRALSKHGGS